MFDISNNGIITMNRGDTWDTEIFVNVGTEVNPEGYSLQEGEYIYFGVMEPNQPFDFALIRKRLDSSDEILEPVESGEEPIHTGRYLLFFTPQDTEHVMPGNYYYEVKLLRKEKDEALIAKGITEHIDTIIPKTKFYIDE